MESGPIPVAESNRDCGVIGPSTPLSGVDRSRSRMYRTLPGQNGRWVFLLIQQIYYRRFD